MMAMAKRSWSRMAETAQEGRENPPPLQPPADDVERLLSNQLQRLDVWEYGGSTWRYRSVQYWWNWRWHNKSAWVKDCWCDPTRRFVLVEAWSHADGGFDAWVSNPYCTLPPEPAQTESTEPEPEQPQQQDPQQQAEEAEAGEGVAEQSDPDL